jgi:hypothetical protein
MARKTLSPPCTARSRAPRTCLKYTEVSILIFEVCLLPAHFPRLVADTTSPQGYYAVPCDFKETISLGKRQESRRHYCRNLMLCFTLHSVRRQAVRYRAQRLPRARTGSYQPPVLHRRNPRKRRLAFSLAHVRTLPLLLEWWQFANPSMMQRWNVPAKRIHHVRYYECQSRFRQTGVGSCATRLGCLKPIRMNQKRNAKLLLPFRKPMDNSSLNKWT